MNKKRVRSLEKAGTPRHWLFVTRPEYYERVEEDITYEPDWWTCDEDTREGDLIFLYCTSPISAIGYILQATSDAESLEYDSYAVERGWDFGCGVIVLHKLARPITFKGMGEIPAIREWRAYRKRFQGTVFEIPLGIWESVNSLRLIAECTGEDVLTPEIARGELSSVIKSEKELEEYVCKNLYLLRRFGFNLKPYVDPRSGRGGRQYVCGEYRCRIDILCVDEGGNFVVLELKNAKAPLRTLSQISFYMGWVNKHFAPRGNVRGLIISRGADDKLKLATSTTPHIALLNVSDVGFRR